jgi:hypothetical protein
LVVNDNVPLPGPAGRGPFLGTNLQVQVLAAYSHTRAELTAATWPGTGRVVRLVLHRLTQREVTQASGPSSVLTAVRDGNLDAVRMPADRPDIDGHVALAARSGFPEPALRLAPRARQVWLDSYLGHVVTRDVVSAGPHWRSQVTLAARCA